MNIDRRKPPSKYISSSVQPKCSGLGHSSSKKSLAFKQEMTSKPPPSKKIQGKQIERQERLKRNATQRLLKMKDSKSKASSRGKIRMKSYLAQEAGTLRKQISPSKPATSRCMPNHDYFSDEGIRSFQRDRPRHRQSKNSRSSNPQSNSSLQMSQQRKQLRDNLNYLFKTLQRLEGKHQQEKFAFEGGINQRQKRRLDKLQELQRIDLVTQIERIQEQLQMMSPPKSSKLISLGQINDKSQ